MGELSELLNMQAVIQANTYGYKLGVLDAESRISYIKEMMLSLHNELHEALNETGWKDWSASRHIHLELYLNELVDAQLLLWNLMLASGLSPDALAYELVERLELKQKLNIQRQGNGY